MPLSEHEQRLLDQMEQALAAEDPKFVNRLNEDPQQSRQRKQIAVGGVIVALGLAVVVLGVMNQLVWLGGAGFAVMVAGAGYALSPGRGRGKSLGSVQADGSITRHRREKGTGQRTKRSAVPRSAASSEGTFMQRLEQRWERRRREGQGW